MADATKTEGETDDPALETRKVWSWPVRVFHWALVVAFVTGFYLGEYRDFSTIQLHFYAGYTVGGLVVLRILYGLFGPRHERIGAMVPGPRRALAYLKTVGRRRPSGVAGHNPLGGLSVVAMLVTLLVQVGTGLFAEDDGLFSAGPLSEYLDSGWVVTVTAWHHTSSRVLLGLIGLHLAAIAFYAVWKRENLVTPMISGWKRVRK